MAEIEKVGNLKSWNLRYQKLFQKYLYWEISYWLSQNFSVQDEKFEINELIQYKTFFQRSVFEMSRSDIVKAKKYCYSIV